MRPREGSLASAKISKHMSFLEKIPIRAVPAMYKRHDNYFDRQIKDAAEGNPPKNKAKQEDEATYA